MLGEVSPARCRDIEQALQLEWLDTNGIGGYGSSTILNCHTRKYHGLLVSQSSCLPDKQVLLSKLDDWVVLNDTKEELRLTVHKYPETFHPSTAPCLSSFSQAVMPSFIYEKNGVKIQKEIMLLYRRDTVLIRYKVLKLPTSLTLCIKPLIAYRNFHHLSMENLYLRVRTFPCKDGFFLSPYDGMPGCFIQVSGGFEFYPSPDWYRTFEYVREKERGFDCREDLFSPGLIEIPFDNGAEIIISASTCEVAESLEELWHKEASRRKELEGRFEGNTCQKALSKAVGHSLIKKESGQCSVVAGYHWFLEWGRDTMISLPGVTLCTGRNNECKEVLKTFASHEKRGLIPNFIGFNENAYNSVDASLWFVWAVQKYLESTGDYPGARDSLWPTIKNIISNYIKGTDYNIRMLESGLLSAGDRNTQLTWMDATVEGKPATPRWGCPVEVNALWYNALCFAAALADRFEDTGFITVIQPVSLDKLKENFIRTFWMEEKGCLGDVWTDGKLDPSVRPNQLFAVSLPHSMLPVEMSRRLVKVVENELLTPFGLRTLSHKDPKYIGTYRGGPSERDMAYHNGAVWPWLLGPFCEALLKTSEDRNEAAARIRKILSGFERHLGEAGIGFISEVFDGEHPHLPNGCIAQTWSSAELLRIFYMIESL